MIRDDVTRARTHAHLFFERQVFSANSFKSEPAQHRSNLVFVHNASTSGAATADVKPLVFPKRISVGRQQHVSHTANCFVFEVSRRRRMRRHHETAKFHHLVRTDKINFADTKRFQSRLHNVELFVLSRQHQQQIAQSIAHHKQSRQHVRQPVEIPGAPVIRDPQRLAFNLSPVSERVDRQKLEDARIAPLV